MITWKEHCYSPPLLAMFGLAVGASYPAAHNILENKLGSELGS